MLLELENCYYDDDIKLWDKFYKVCVCFIDILLIMLHMLSKVQKQPKLVSREARAQDTSQRKIILP